MTPRRKSRPGGQLPALLLPWLTSLLLLGYILTSWVAQRFSSCEQRVQAVRDRLVEVHSQQRTIDPSVIEELYNALSATRLQRIADQYQEAYASASPFPHIAIDGIFPDRILQQVVQENPESLVDGSSGCIKSAQSCFHESVQNGKSAIEDEELMGLYTRILFGALKSSNFIAFLERLSGITSLIPDPHYRGSGLHFTSSPHGKLDVHADFNRYKPYQLDRRVNAFIFLNPDWPDDYGGHLELWSSDMRSCGQRILPVLGRFVVFSSTDFSYHGHPAPLTAPAGRARRSMALYYYTNGRPATECLEGDCLGQHSTLFQTPVGCETCQEQTCRAYDEEFRPEWVDLK